MKAKPLTLIDALERAALAAPHGGVTEISRHGQETFHSWSDLFCEAQVFAANLRARGMGAGDTAAIIMPNSWGFIVSFVGCMMAGAIPAALYPPMRLGLLEEYYSRTAACLARIEAKILITGENVQKLLGSTLRHYVPPLGMVQAEDFFTPPTKKQAISPTEQAFIQFSSGTTAAPKPVLLSHRNVLSNIDSILGHFPASFFTNPTMASWLPLYHDMGLIGGLFATMLAHGRLYLLRPEEFLAQPKLWLTTIARKQINASAAPGFALGLCTQKVSEAELTGLDFSSWGLLLLGAEYLSPATLEAFSKKLAPYGFRKQSMVPAYGLAEATLGVTFASWPNEELSRFFAPYKTGDGAVSAVEGGRKIVSVGKPLRGVEIEIRDMSGAPLPENVTGQIFVRGPSVATHIYGDRNSHLKDGWLATGDLGFLYQGELFISGRSKDLIIIRGRNIAPQEIEENLYHIPDVRPGCVVAVADLSSDAGERLYIFVETLKPSKQLEVECRRQITRHFHIVADDLVLLPPGTIPRTSSGKLRRFETLRRFRAGTLVHNKPLSKLELGITLVKNQIDHWRYGRL